MKRLYEFTALIHVSVVVAADSEHAARDELDSWGHGAWYTSGEATDPTNIELEGVRDLPTPYSADDLADLAHYVVD